MTNQTEECKRLAGEFGKASVRVAMVVTGATIDAFQLAESQLMAAIDRLAASQPAAAVPSSESVSMPPYWSVTVEADGETLVSIGHDWLSGSRALEQPDERTILGAARHLLSFIGYGLPPCRFNPDEEQAAPTGASTTQAELERQLDDALKERDAASDYIDALLDEVLGADRNEWTSAYGHADAMEEVRERMAALHAPSIDKAWGRFEAALHDAATPPKGESSREAR